MSSSTQTPAPWITTEDFHADPRFEHQHYLINGEVLKDMGNTHPPHEIVKTALHQALILLLRDYGIRGRILSETAYEFDEGTLLIPDSSVQIPEWACPSSGYFRGAPEIAIEVLSPSNTHDELQRKAHLYHQHGAHWVWVLNPGSQEAFIVRPSGHWDLTDVFEICGRHLTVNRESSIWP